MLLRLSPALHWFFAAICNFVFRTLDFDFASVDAVHFKGENSSLSFKILFLRYSNCVAVCVCDASLFTCLHDIPGTVTRRADTTDRFSLFTYSCKWDSLILISLVLFLTLQSFSTSHCAVGMQRIFRSNVHWFTARVAWTRDNIGWYPGWSIADAGTVLLHGHDWIARR